MSNKSFTKRGFASSSLWGQVTAPLVALLFALMTADSFAGPPPFKSLPPSQQTQINSQTDQQFWAAHPELNHRSLDPNSKADAASRKELMNMRNGIMNQQFPNQPKPDSGNPGTGAPQSPMTGPSTGRSAPAPPPYPTTGVPDYSKPRSVGDVN
jgi:hypothetical protein